jgi:hypothetical protein
VRSPLELLLTPCWMQRVRITSHLENNDHWTSGDFWTLIWFHFAALLDICRLYLGFSGNLREQVRKNTSSQLHVYSHSYLDSCPLVCVLEMGGRCIVLPERCAFAWCACQSTNLHSLCSCLWHVLESPCEVSLISGL